MKNLRAMAMSTVVFGTVGPAIGAVAIWQQRPPASFRDVLLLSYIFGSIPALIAGVAYGGLRARGNGPSSRWYTRALLGASAGLLGCLVFFLFVSVYDLLIVSGRTVGDLEIGFLRRLVLAGIPAGTTCGAPHGLSASPTGRPAVTEFRGPSEETILPTRRPRIGSRGIGVARPP
jgi:hypothetical protein